MDGVERVERGEIELGGCTIIVDESPAWKLSHRECGLELGQLPAS